MHFLRTRRRGAALAVDDDRGLDRGAVKRVLVHSGKIHWDLRSELEKNPNPEIALVRIEQFYPTPIEALKAITDTYPNAELVWVQNEPKNQGAWPFMALNLPEELAHHGEERPLRVVSRPASASPSTGSAKVHAVEQETLHEEAFGRRG